MGEIARGPPSEGAIVRSRNQSPAMIGYGPLSMAHIAGVREGAQYVNHADWKGGDPNCVAILIPESGVANRREGNNAYQISVSSIREILSGSPDSPRVLEFPASEEGTELGRYASHGPNYILDMKAAPPSGIIRRA